jgi:hypothetical protein
MNAPINGTGYYPDSRPWTRWWWYANPVTPEQLRAQLDWLASMGFGGVEIAWVYPQPELPAGVPWLSEAWSELVAEASRYAESIGLGCDFTFGTLWPFGGTFVTEADASKRFDGPSPQRLRKSWEDPEQGLILDHLNAAALERYAQRMGNALKPAIGRRRPAFFCDSWEVRTEGLWADGFGEVFQARFGYDLLPIMPEIDEHPDERYDYRKLIGEFAQREFFAPYTELCRRHGGFARVQCHGAPVDLVHAYATAEVPESEAILFDPEFSQIAASGALLGNRPVVAAEAFTCIYGWKPWPGPGHHQGEERIGDIKLLGDAMIANGVNHIIWHGTPLRPLDPPAESAERHWFYASVHVGPESAFADALPAYNRYLAETCALMRQGRPLTDVAVYLPLEDNRMLDRVPPDRKKPSGEYFWELHDLRTPEDLEGRQPAFITRPFLADAAYRNGVLESGQARFSALVVDVEWLDQESLVEIARLARAGLPVCLKRRPKQPGRVKSADYEPLLDELLAQSGVVDHSSKLPLPPPCIEGESLPPHRCRVVDDELIVFFAHPAARGLTYPMRPDQFLDAGACTVSVTVNWQGHRIDAVLEFGLVGSLVMRVDRSGVASIEPTAFRVQ